MNKKIVFIIMGLSLTVVLSATVMVFLYKNNTKIDTSSDLKNNETSYSQEKNVESTEKIKTSPSDSNEPISSANLDNSAQEVAIQLNSDEELLIELMKEYELYDISTIIENKDYEQAGQYVNNMYEDDYIKMINMKNNISDEEYQDVITMLRKNGYTPIAAVMFTINSDGSCH